MGDIIKFPGVGEYEEVRSAYELLTICVDHAFTEDQITETEYLMLCDAIDTISPYQNPDA